MHNRHHKAILALVLIAMSFAFFLAPNFIQKAIAEADYEMIFTIILYLPGFFIIMGLFEVWLPEKFIASHLGKHSGIKGSIYSFILGTVIPGPLYVSFPIAAMLMKEGISRFNVALFIGAWSCFKIGEEIFELQFLGLRFMVIRTLVAIPFIILIAFIIDKIHFKTEQVIR